ncbi:hypothetical protein, partial [Klebsiella pneumoniae]|uniref:hypothetical protein n=1 Tax=Klebsiella pneumoniae TaxID=573 RepID=UPI0021CAE340
MTRTELEGRLATIGVHPSIYSLDGMRRSDRVCVVAETDGWGVYSVERDRPKKLGRFSRVENA